MTLFEDIELIWIIIDIRLHPMLIQMNKLDAGDIVTGIPSQISIGWSLNWPCFRWRIRGLIVYYYSPIRGIQYQVHLSSDFQFITIKSFFDCQHCGFWLSPLPEWMNISTCFIVNTSIANTLDNGFANIMHFGSTPSGILKNVFWHFVEATVWG